METLLYSGITERFLPFAILGFSPARQIKEKLTEGTERQESQEETGVFVCLGFCFYWFFLSFSHFVSISSFTLNEVLFF